MSVIGRRPSPLTSSEPRFARHDANLFGNYQSRPSIPSLVFLGSLCVPLTWGHIKYRPSEVNNPIVISNPISNLQYVVLRYKWQRQQERKKINKYYQAISFLRYSKPLVCWFIDQLMRLCSLIIVCPTDLIWVMWSEYLLLRTRNSRDPGKSWTRGISRKSWTWRTHGPKR